MNTNRVRINTFALAARLPTMHANRKYIETDGLISYGANYPDSGAPAIMLTGFCAALRPAKFRWNSQPSSIW